MSLQRRKTELPAPSGGRALQPAGDRQEFLSFVLADEVYALPLIRVREILRPPPITEVPRAPADVVGIISVRGRITTIVDLRKRLRVERAPIDRRTRILLVDNGDEILGCVVDRVLQVHRLAPDEMEMAVVVGGDVAEYVIGIGRPQLTRAKATREAVSEDEDILVLLDPVALLRR